MLWAFPWNVSKTRITFLDNILLQKSVRWPVLWIIHCKVYLVQSLRSWLEDRFKHASLLKLVYWIAIVQAGVHMHKN